MDAAKKNRAFQNAALFVCACLTMICIFLRPEAAAQGVRNGLALCARSLIPSLFPFLIVTRLILTGRTARWLGLPLLPYTRALGLRSPKAATALLLGLTGGFCGGAKAVQTLYEQKDITQREAALLLCCTINSGLGFVVGGVGGGMLGSTFTGWLLLAALSLASFIAALLCKFFLRNRLREQTGTTANIPTERASEPPSKDALSQFVAAVQDSVNALLTLCGFVVAFSFFTALIAPPGAEGTTLYAFALPFEVTAACNAAAAGTSAYKVYLCCASLSCMGLSIFAQIRALTSEEISLMPLALSRVLHLPISLAVFALLLRLFPNAAHVSATYTAMFRMPWEAFTAVFLLCAVFFNAQPATRFSAKKPSR